MPRAANVPGERLTGGFFRAGKYLVLSSSYQVHQFHTKEGKTVGKPSVMHGLELVQIDDSVSSLKDVKVAPDAMRLDQWYPVGGNLEMFYCSDENDKKVDKGQFVGSKTARGIFEDSSSAQFVDALINGGYDRERWKDHEAYGLTGCILVLSEVPDKKAPLPKKPEAANSRMAQEAKEAGADDPNRPRTIVVPSEYIDGPEDVLGAELPKKLWPKGTPAEVTPIGERGKKTPTTPGTNGHAASVQASDNGDAADLMDEASLVEVLTEAAKKAVGDSPSKLDPILRGGIVAALGGMELDEANLAVLREMVSDATTRSSIMTSIGFNKSGANWVRK